MTRGSCLCGSVVFEIGAPMTDALTCHCKQCRRQSGHFFAAAHAPWDDIRFDRKEGLACYRASDTASRGFCRACGSTLFWHSDGSPEVAVALGAIDGETGLVLARHVWVNTKGDYYDIADDLPQQEGFEG